MEELNPSSSRDAQHSSVVVLTVGNDLALDYVTYVSDNQPLALGASLTPEGLTLNRLDSLADSALPVDENTEDPMATYNPANAQTFGALFQ